MSTSRENPISKPAIIEALTNPELFLKERSKQVSSTAFPDVLSPALARREIDSLLVQDDSPFVMELVRKNIVTQNDGELPGIRQALATALSPFSDPKFPERRRIGYKIKRRNKAKSQKPISDYAEGVVRGTQTINSADLLLALRTDGWPTGIYGDLFDVSTHELAKSRRERMLLWPLTGTKSNVIRLGLVSGVTTVAVLFSDYKLALSLMSIAGFKYGKDILTSQINKKILHETVTYIRGHIERIPLDWNGELEELKSDNITPVQSKALTLLALGVPLSQILRIQSNSLGERSGAILKGYFIRGKNSNKTSDNTGELEYAMDEKIIAVMRKFGYSQTDKDLLTDLSNLSELDMSARLLKIRREIAAITEKALQIG